MELRGIEGIQFLKNFTRDFCCKDSRDRRCPKVFLQRTELTVFKSFSVRKFFKLFPTKDKDIFLVLHEKCNISEINDRLSSMRKLYTDFLETANKTVNVADISNIMNEEGISKRYPGIKPLRTLKQCLFCPNCFSLYTRLNHECQTNCTFQYYDGSLCSTSYCNEEKHRRKKELGFQNAISDIPVNLKRFLTGEFEGKPKNLTYYLSSTKTLNNSDVNVFLRLIQDICETKRIYVKTCNCYGQLKCTCQYSSFKFFSQSYHCEKRRFLHIMEKKRKKENNDIFLTVILVDCPFTSNSNFFDNIVINSSDFNVKLRNIILFLNSGIYTENSSRRNSFSSVIPYEYFTI